MSIAFDEEDARARLVRTRRLLTAAIVVLLLLGAPFALALFGVVFGVLPMR